MPGSPLTKPKPINSCLAVCLISVSLLTACSQELKPVSPKRLPYVTGLYRNSQLSTKDNMGLDLDIFDEQNSYNGVLDVALDGKSLGKGMFDPDREAWLLSDLKEDDQFVRMAGRFDFLRQYAAATYGVSGDDVLMAGGNLADRYNQTIEAPTRATFVYKRLHSMMEPGPPLNLPRRGHRMISLKDGRVLIWGGTTSGGRAVQEIELFDSKSMTIRVIGKSRVERRDFLVTMLKDGRVLVTGGIGPGDREGPQGLCSSVEMFDPANNSVTLLGQTQEARVGQKAIVIGEHSALLIRGKVPSAAGQIEESRTFEYFSGDRER